jgi:hypothetical protein
MRDLFIAPALALALIWPSASTALAQARQQNRPAAITDPAQGGVDYLLQGEYYGWLSGGTASGPVGVQVVALGDGKFDAVQYRGGLPGNGWDRSEKTKLTGAIENDRLILTSDDESIFIGGGGQAVAVDSQRREIGRLTKMDRKSPTLGLAPPASAVVLFDGRSTDQFVQQPAPKVSPDGYLMAGVLTKMPVGAFRMHVEFKTPFMPTARDQQRGNSGVYIQRRYEVQILDSFGLEGAFNEAGSLYRQTPPDLNMAFPPLTWQTYDIWFTPPQFAADGKTKTANARITILHNGIPVHWHREITAKTGGGQQEGPQPLQIQLQDHGNPVMYRNIWLIPGDGDQDWDSLRSASTSANNCSSCGRVLFHHHRHRCG